MILPLLEHFVNQREKADGINLSKLQQSEYTKFSLQTKLSAAYPNVWGERGEGTGVPIQRSIHQGVELCRRLDLNRKVITEKNYLSGLR